ncbi:sodium:proton antiporter [Draconibacterium sediminis]|uniref:cation:proton antiporter n=1 Tax=Draconibacterium sediminis TaxID=1544798 RepID=UPI0026EFF026|nr:cation:proton antiporter [Draconibacterium sediminis]
MSLYITIIILGLLIFLSHVFNQLFDKTKIPNVLLLLLIGIIIGPVSGIVTIDFFGKLGNVFTTITLVVILFESGAGLHFREIKKAIGSATVLTLLNFIITILITSWVSRWLLGVDVMSSVFIGAIVGGTSSAVVIPMVKQLKMGEKSTSVLILESALSDVLCLVVGLALLDGIAENVMSPQMILLKMWKAFVFAIILGLLCGFLWSTFIGKIRSVKNSMFTTLAFVFVLYGVVELLRLNGGIAVLSFGIILGNIDGLGESKKFRKVFTFKSSGFNPNERDFFAEVVFIMQTYFFVYVGISLQFGVPAIYATGFLIVLLIIAFRIPGVVYLTGKNITKPEKTIMAVMTPKGLVPAVLASLPLQRGLAHGEIIIDLGYSIVLFSIVICSLLVIMISLKPNLLDGFKKRRIETVGSEEIPFDVVQNNSTEHNPSDNISGDKNN